MTDALRDAKSQIERSEMMNNPEYATSMISSAIALALIAIAERMDKFLELLELENERKELLQ